MGRNALPYFVIFFVFGLVWMATDRFAPGTQEMVASSDVTVRATAPGITDDISQNFLRGFIWIDTVGSAVYIAEDTTAGAAVWTDITAGGLTTVDISADTNLVAGTNITLTGDTLQVDDAFLLNSGDVGTGVYDFGGATDFELPNGAAPTVNAAGELAIDTTDDQLQYFGAATRVLTYKRDKGFTLASPADVDNILLWKAPYALTITDIFCIVDPADTAETVVIDIQERDGSGDTPATVDATITCSNTGAEDDGALSNGPIDSGDWISIDIGAVTGTVTQLSVTVHFTVDGV